MPGNEAYFKAFAAAKKAVVFGDAASRVSAAVVQAESQSLTAPAQRSAVSHRVILPYAPKSLYHWHFAAIVP
jgi:hypothetical protein